MSLDTQIQPSKNIIGNWICSKLQDNGSGFVLGHYLVHDISEKIIVGFIVYAYFKRNIQGVVFAFALAYWVETAGPWEKIIAVLMKTDGHNSIGQVESLLHSVSVVDIDVNVEDSWMVFQQLENT